MPELPEVETVRRVLLTEIIGKKINSVEIRYPNIVETEENLFKSLVEGRSYKDITRLGKHLIFHLDEGNIVSHLRMEGKYFYVPKGSLDNKHIHVIYHLDNGYDLMYQDVRKFGRMVYKTDEELYTTKPLSEAGVDPILTKQIEIKDIYDKIVSRPYQIKTVLLEQNIISGLGNIYVDEVLHAAHIIPTKDSHDITLEEVKTLVNESVRILSKAIEYKGTTIRSYTSSLGVEGQYQRFLLVHTKTECGSCGEKIEKIKIGGRSTYYCPKCQR